QMSLFAVIMDVLHDRVELGKAASAALILLLYIYRRLLSRIRHLPYGKLSGIATVRHRRRPAVCGLEQLEDLVVPHLQICPARLLDLRRQRGFEHFVTVFLALYFQAELKSRVTPD